MTRLAILLTMLAAAHAAGAQQFEDLAALDRRIAVVAGPARALDRAQPLARCSAPPAIAPAGSYVTIGCAAPHWRAVVASLVVASVRPAPDATLRPTMIAARFVARGTTITAADLAPGAGHGFVDAIDDPALAIGRVARRALAPGTPLRASALAPPMVVRRGVGAALRVEGAGFVVEALGAATTDAAAGASVAAANAATGVRVRGVASTDGAVIVGALKPGDEASLSEEKVNMRNRR